MMMKANRFQNCSFVLAAFLACTTFSQEVKTLQPKEPRPHGAELQAAKLDPEVIGQIDVMFQEHIQEGHISGVVAMIVRNGAVGYLEEFGYRDIAAQSPMQHDSLLRIYSMTKPIVAAAAMALYEEGKFTLDEPISKHLPEWENVKVKADGESIDVLKPITPRMLMTHTTGISYDGFSKDTATISLDEFSKMLAERPLEFQPSTKHLYGYSIDVLGRYIEVIEGKTLDVVLDERFFKPLNMKDTAFWVQDPTDQQRMAEVYTRRWDGDLTVAMDRTEVFSKPSAMLGGQGLISTADDYARFCAMMLNGGEVDGVRVLKTETVDLMFEDHITEFLGNYGLGGWADGRGTYWWAGYAGTQFWIDRNTNTYVVYMVQKVGYQTPTEGRFRSLAKKAMQAGAEENDSK